MGIIFLFSFSSRWYKAFYFSSQNHKTVAVGKDHKDNLIPALLPSAGNLSLEGSAWNFMENQVYGVYRYVLPIFLFKSILWLYVLVFPRFVTGYILWCVPSLLFCAAILGSTCSPTQCPRYQGPTWESCCLQNFQQLTESCLRISWNKCLIYASR